MGSPCGTGAALAHRGMTSTRPPGYWCLVYLQHSIDAKSNPGNLKATTLNFLPAEPHIQQVVML